MDLLPMLAAASGAGGETDDDFASTVLLLHGDGTNGAQNNTFLDSSTNNFTITRAGNTTQGSFSPFSKPDGRWGVYFDGNDDGVESPSSSNFAWALDDFCVEFWVSTLAIGTIWDQRPNQTNGDFLTISADASGFVTMAINSAIRIQGTISIFDGLFHHVCVERNSGTFTLYVDGVADGTSTYGNSMSANQRVRLGHAAFTGSTDLNGYISNARAVKDDYVYGGAFTPPTSPLGITTGYNGLGTTVLLTAQSNRFVDNSASAATFTITGTPKVTPLSPFPLTTEYTDSINGGSGYFDGSGDYLSVPDGSWITLGTNDFTAEAWIYNTVSTGASQYICGQGDASGQASSVSFEMYLTSSRTLSGGIYVGSQKYVTSSGTIPLNTWTHVALVRDGGNVRMYINGVQDGVNTTAGASSVVDQSSQFSLARAGEYNGLYFNGFISGFRFINETCLYPSGTTFTPPTAPLTAITDTELLCNFSNAGIFDNTGFNNLESVGNSQVDTTTKKYGTGSLSFDGTSDWLFIPSSTEFGFGSGDFTIEGWFNFVSHADFRVLVDFRTSSNQIVPTMYTNASGHLFYFVAGSNRISDTTGLSTGVFIHIAVARSGTSTKMFVNGTQVGSTWTDTSNYIAGPLRLGTNFDNTTPFNGFIDDLRISRIARYTTTFTPPTKAFPNIGA